MLDRALVLSLAKFEAVLRTIFRHALPASLLLVPRIVPWSISLVYAPLPTAFVLLDHAQKALAARLTARHRLLR
jgi:hypothetical protein